MRQTDLAGCAQPISVSQHQTAHLPTRLAKTALITSHQGEPGPIPGRVTPRFSQVGIVPDDVAGGPDFSGISRFPRLFILVMFHTHFDVKRHPILFTHSLTTPLHFIPVMRRVSGGTRQAREIGTGDVTLASAWHGSKLAAATTCASRMSATQTTGPIQLSIRPSQGVARSSVIASLAFVSLFSNNFRQRNRPIIHKMVERDHSSFCQRCISGLMKERGKTGDSHVAEKIRVLVAPSEKWFIYKTLLQQSAHESGALSLWCNLPDLVKHNLQGAEEHSGSTTLSGLQKRPKIP
ncbi:hypothetical protein PR048_014880 [Dryococelus australis]|uniref:Uncharacterized protein n=1 Tax=Dryococelus australis TaxID=614101 RepID=A0ABQ9HFU7_9NEOP|nr:hypothetical protein PR048_014880 [Dryococelus australis]